MSKKCKRILTIAMILMSSVLSYQANATAKWDAVQITCSKDLNYFSLKTLALESIQLESQEAEERVQTESKIFDIAYIHKHPYVCNLPDQANEGLRINKRTITVAIINYIESRDIQSCGISPSFTIELQLNNYTIAAHRLNSCANDFLHFIELDNFNMLSDCEIGNSLEKSGCKSQMIQFKR